MQRLSAVAGRDDLEWRDTSGVTRAFELRAGAETVASLTFRRRSDAFARGSTREGLWTFDRTDYFPAKAIVREPAGRVVATAVDDTIEFGGCTSFRACDGFWGPQIVLAGNDGAFVARFQRQRGRRPDVVAISAHGALLPELPVLILLAWYIPVVWLWSDD